MNNIKFVIRNLGKEIHVVLIIVLFGAIVSSITQISIINLQRLFINFIADKASMKELGYTGIFAILLTLISLWSSQKIEKKMSMYINERRETIFKNFLTYDLDENGDIQDSMKVYKQYFSDLSRLVKQVIPQFVMVIVTLVLMSLTTSLWSWKILLLVLLTALLYTRVIPLASKLEHLEEQEGENGEKIWGGFHHILENRHVLLFYPKSVYFLEKLAVLLVNHQKINRTKGKILAQISVLGGATNMLRELGILFIAFHLLAIPLGDVLALFSVTSFLNSSLAQIVESYTQLQKSVVTIRKIDELDHLQTTDGQSTLTKPCSVPLVLENLTYRWGKTKISFPPLTITTNEFIQVCGENGSGKSTVMAILAGTRRPFSGRLSANQRTLQEITALLTQKIVFFSGTILQNITCFEERPNREKVLDLVKKVGLLEWLTSLDNGLETDISRQSGISGGQMQRLAICRTFYQEKEIILLDEPFSALDARSSAKVLALMKEAYEAGKTLIFIDHKGLVEENFLRKICMEEISD
ncbi:hypothetical protein IGI37_003429 [Enterococcus sp. AZ194]|uniref:ATP-binding cassette domain-containing protein n=1 Tax=Enterococcus sp. AZ194 TaxID=2774629 RepID=UPI003F1E768B